MAINEIYISLKFWRTNLHPSEITRILMIKPTSAFGKYERDEKKRLPRENLWTFKTRSSSINISDHENYFISMFAHKSHLVSKCGEGGDVSLDVVVFRDNDSDGEIQLSDQIEQLANEMGSKIEYFYYKR